MSQVKRLKKKLQPSNTDNVNTNFVQEKSHAVGEYLKGGHKLQKEQASKEEVNEFEKNALKEIDKIDEKYNHKTTETKIDKWSEKYGL